MQRAAALLILAAMLLSGCGTPANGTETTMPISTTLPASTPTPSPTTPPAPTPNPEELAREQRLSEEQDGFIWDKGYLCAIDENGDLKKDCYIGILYFGKDGRYTCGDKSLDRLVAGVIKDNTDESMTRMEKLRAMYDYTMENITYVGFANHELSYKPAHGPNGWMQELAKKALEEGVGNCYYFAATFAALARAVGYQAYATGGIIGAVDDQHGWVQIVDEDGVVWVSDPEMEYKLNDWHRRINSEEKAPDLFYKPMEEVEGALRMSYSAQRDPYQAEAEEAEKRAKEAENLTTSEPAGQTNP